MPVISVEEWEAKKGKTSGVQKAPEALNVKEEQEETEDMKFQVYLFPGAADQAKSSVCYEYKGVLGVFDLTNGEYVVPSANTVENNETREALKMLGFQLKREFEEAEIVKEEVKKLSAKKVYSLMHPDSTSVTTELELDIAGKPVKVAIEDGRVEGANSKVADALVAMGYRIVKEEDK